MIDLKTQEAQDIIKEYNKGRTAQATIAYTQKFGKPGSAKISEHMRKLAKDRWAKHKLAFKLNNDL